MRASLAEVLAVRATIFAIVLLSAAPLSLAAQRRDGIASESLRVPASIVERINRKRVASSIQCKCGRPRIIARARSRPIQTPRVQLRPEATRLRTESALVVVDDVVLSASRAATLDLSKLDVRNVEVLNGRAGLAAYGARGASGVIIIRTQRGRR